MTERVARKGVERKESDVDRQDERTDTNAKATVEEEGLDRVVPKENDEKNCEIEEVAMYILQNKRKRSFAKIVGSREFANRASGGIEKESAVIGFAVVVTSGAKA